MAAIFRAFFGYCFLVFMIRIVVRRPGKQMTPFEYVLIFFIGGLTLTGIVADDRSLTNALCQIATVACSHYLLTWLRRRSPWFSKIIDGTPAVLLEKGQWRTELMRGMHFTDDDVMAAARSKGLQSLEEISYAILERNGGISIIAKKAS